MNQRIYDRIREILETTPGLTQKGLAERMGLNPAAINRMLYGRRNIMAEEIPTIENYLGVRLELSAPEVSSNVEYRQDNHASASRRGFSDVPARVLEGVSPAQLVPVYGYVEGSMQKGLNLSDSNVVDWIARHPAQQGAVNAFAVYVLSNSMEPRYFQGELVYIHPGRPPEMNRDCIIEMKNGDAFLRRFLHQSEEKICVAQFNPLQEKEFSKQDIKAIYAVVGRG